MLLNTQRNELFRILEKQRIQPCDFIEDFGDEWYRIRLKGQESSIYFELQRIRKDDSSCYRISKRPGSIATPDTEEVSEPKD
jgi:hypothetical protein